MNFDPAAVRAQREKLLLRLLFRTTDAMNRTMAERVRARGFADFQPSFTSLLVHIDTEGTRIGTIAARMDVSRQAASQRLQEIEARGYIERAPDPSDGRAVVVRHTEIGRQLLVTAVEVMLGIETEYAALIGAGRLRQLKRLLAQIAQEIDPVGALAPPKRRASGGRRPSA
jgi:DNA-binding MarR family transcriptional regulator